MHFLTLSHMEAEFELLNFQRCSADLCFLLQGQMERVILWFLISTPLLISGFILEVIGILSIRFIYSYFIFIVVD